MYGINHPQQQQSHHSMEVKPSYTSPHINPTFAADTNSYGIDNNKSHKTSQNLDFKNIVLLIIGKFIVILIYFLLSDYKLLNFVFVLLLMSIDFWMNKNIYGKHLAGLRWWIEQDHITGEQAWIFQSADPNIQIHTINNGIFWIGNLITGLFWFVNFFVILIITNSLFWISLCIFCFGLIFINLICFYKCRGNHQKKLVEIIQKVGFKSAANLLGQHEQLKQNKIDSQRQERQQRQQKQDKESKFQIE